MKAERKTRENEEVYKPHANLVRIAGESPNDMITRCTARVGSSIAVVCILELSVC